MFAKHEVLYIWKKSRHGKRSYPEKVYGSYILEVTDENQSITLRFDSHSAEYNGMTEPHGSMGKEQLWKWKSSGNSLI